MLLVVTRSIAITTSIVALECQLLSYRQFSYCTVALSPNACTLCLAFPNMAPLCRFGWSRTVGRLRIHLHASHALSSLGLTPFVSHSHECYTTPTSLLHASRRYAIVGDCDTLRLFVALLWSFVTLYRYSYHRLSVTLDRSSYYSQPHLTILPKHSPSPQFSSWTRIIGT